MATIYAIDFDGTLCGIAVGGEAKKNPNAGEKHRAEKKHSSPVKRRNIYGHQQSR